MPTKRRKRAPASKSRKRKAPLEEETWYSIKDILDERIAKKGVEYLVDWDDNVVTGEAYSPTWVAGSEVTEVALQAWEAIKSARDKATNLAATHTEVEDSQDSQPPQTANRKHARKADAVPLSRPRTPIADQGGRFREPTRLAHSATPSEEPTPSFTSRASVDTAEAPDSLPQHYSSVAHPSQRFVIELAKDSQFDPSEYLSAANTQTSGHSSQSLAELEDRDQRLAFASQISARTVPDSQEPSGPTWSPGHVGTSAPTPNAAALDVGSSNSELSNIPSHQPGQASSLGTQGDNFPAPSASATRSSSHLNSARPLQLIDTQSQSSASPVFRTQPPLRRTFAEPESSSRSVSAVRATPLEESQLSIENSRPREQNSAESQDAQVLNRSSLGSVVNAFSGSHDPSHSEAAASNNSNRSSEERNTIKPPADKNMEQSRFSNTPAPSEGRKSAAEELSQLLDLDTSIIGTGAAAPHETEERDISDGKDQQLAVEHQQHMADSVFGTSHTSPPRTLMPEEAHHTQHSTVSPADISRQTEFERTALPLMPSLASQGAASSHLYSSSALPVPAGQAISRSASSEASSDGVPDPGLLEHVVTLPFQASLRPFYDDTLLEYRRQVTKFGTIFNDEEYVEPEAALVAEIDGLLNRLHNICDYPQDAVGTSLADLPPSQLAKYSCDANPKFNFVSELLQGLRKDTKILIVARSVELLRLLYYLTETLEVECTCEAIEKSESKFATSAAQVTLALSSEYVNGLDFDVVVAFDHSFSRSPVSKSLSARIPDTKRPLVLILVTTHSIEHLDLHVPEDLGPLERKNALLSSIVRARQLMSDPDRGYPEPYQLANIFVEFLNGDVDTVIWEPVAVPDDVLDFYVSTQSRSQMPAATTPERENGRKRKLDDSDDEDAKRIRIFPLKESTVETNEPPMPDDVKEMLESSFPIETPANSTQVQVKVSLAVLQALAEKHAEFQHEIAAKHAEAEYKAVISGLEQRVKEYERTTAKIYASHRLALEDRSKFEAEKVKAETELRLAAESTQRDKDKTQQRIAELEATVARLTAGPDGSEDSPLARSEKLLKEAQEKVQMLEKRLENAHTDGEYVRNLYQDASTSASAFRTENNELKEQVDDLRKKTLDTLGRIHQVQTESEIRQYLRQIRELKTQVREREIELDRAREELRQLKNGRRETRQASVPRSPRMGMMSPRPGRVYGGSASRGTSPAPTSGVDAPAGMQYMSTQQPGNGRWNHLRD